MFDEICSAIENFIDFVWSYELEFSKGKQITILLFR